MFCTPACSIFSNAILLPAPPCS